MNRILLTSFILIFIVAVAVIGWRTFTPTPKPALQAAPKPLAARPTPPKKRLAPEGTYFLLQPASLTTSAGVIGFWPGAKVTLIKQDGSSSTVTDGEHQFDIESSHLTNDLDIAARVAQADSDIQKKIEEQIEKWREEHEKQQQDEIALLEKQEKEQKGKQPAARGSNPLESGPHDSTKAKKHTDANGRTYWIDVQGRRHYD